MNQLLQATARNRLLALVPCNDFALVRPYLKRVSYRPGDVVARMGTPLDQVCFLEGGIAAYLAPAAGGGRAAVGLVGQEGMIGIGCLFGQTRWSHEVVLRGADATALVIEAARLVHACRQSAPLQELLLRFAGNLLLQIARTSTVNVAAPVERRLARWLLLYHDRLEGDEFPITHEELGIMLAVRRASATEALHMLEGEGAIRSLRGRVVVRDRQRLEELAAEAYGDVEADYRDKLGPFGKGMQAAPDAARATG